MPKSEAKLSNVRRGLTMLTNDIGAGGGWPMPPLFPKGTPNRL